MGRSIPMISRQVAAPLAASLLGLVMCAGAYGQYVNQPVGRPGGEVWPSGGGFYATNSYYVPSVASYAPSYMSTTSFESAYVPSNDTALLRVRLPADAKLFFGTTEATAPSGSMRLFRSPSLEPGSNYQYDLRARWTENGRTVERTRRVPIHANDVVNVDFTHGG
jgi:uncharacterized protein (TIGR03000 family)